MILLLVIIAGCDDDRDPAGQLPDSNIELTDGFCMVSGDQVVLNHHDIAYYDFSAHLLYLKSPKTFSDVLSVYGVSAVYAGWEKMYDLNLHPGYSSTMPQGPFIWTEPTFYPDYIIAIDQMWTYEQILDGSADSREDPRIVEALEKYGQFRNGLQCVIDTILYTSPEEVEVRLELTNPDEENYYYLDPGKMGMGLFHYFTNGLYVWDSVSYQYLTQEVEVIPPDPWDSYDMEWMSLLEGGSSVTLTISYDLFDTVQPGTYAAFFTFPGMHFQVEREDLEQANGRIWLGDIDMHSTMMVE